MSKRNQKVPAASVVGAELIPAVVVEATNKAKDDAANVKPSKKEVTAAKAVIAANVVKMSDAIADMETSKAGYDAARVAVGVLVWRTAEACRVAGGTFKAWCDANGFAYSTLNMLGRFGKAEIAEVGGGLKVMQHERDENARRNAEARARKDAAKLLAEASGTTPAGRSPHQNNKKASPEDAALTAIANLDETAQRNIAASIMEADDMVLMSKADATELAEYRNMGPAGVVAAFVALEPAERKRAFAAISAEIKAMLPTGQRGVLATLAATLEVQGRKETGRARKLAAA